MIGAVYALGVVLVFLVALIPCWGSQFDPWMGYVENVVWMLLTRTLYAAFLGLTWPVALPLLIFLWAASR